jgi:opacity protein-like surface antigen
MRISIYSLLFLVAVVSTSAAQTQQPTPPAGHLDLAVTYDADRTNLTTGSSFWMQGGSAEAVGVFPHGLGLVANVTGLHAESISSTQVPLSLVAVTFGPRYTWRTPWHARKHGLSLFGQALVGEAHGFDSLFPAPVGVRNSATNFALQAGGGVDLALSHRVSLQLLQADWLRTQLPNSSTGVQNHLSINAGIVFHF